MTLAAAEARIGALAWIRVRGSRLGRTDGTLALTMLIVPLGYLGVMMLYPLLKEVWLSFTDARMTNPDAGTFIGLQNYRTLLEGPDLPRVLMNTAVYTLGTSILALAVGIASALALNARFAGRSILRALLSTPWAIPGVAAALIWLWMFKDDGILNRFLAALGASPVSWLASPSWAMVSVIVVTAWLFSPFVMLVTLSALQSVPEEVLEAARVDGASAMSRFRFVVWAHIAPTVRLLTLLLTIWTLRRWDVIAVLTNGGPVNSTSTVVVATQQQAFTYQQVGQGAAYAVVGMVFASMLAVAYHLLDQREARKAAR